MRPYSRKEDGGDGENKEWKKFKKSLTKKKRNCILAKTDRPVGNIRPWDQLLSPKLSFCTVSLHSLKEMVEFEGILKKVMMGISLK